MDGGAWWAAFHGVATSGSQLSNFTFTFMQWRRKWQHTPVFLPGESQGRQSLVGCHLWGHTESDTNEWLHFHFYALEKEMATHSSVLAWRIPGTGEPGRLLSMGSHRVGHDWSDLAAAGKLSLFSVAQLIYSWNTTLSWSIACYGMWRWALCFPMAASVR